MLQLSLMMMCGLTGILIGYSILSTITIVILSLLINHADCPVQMCDGKEMTTQQETHYDIFNIDSSSNQETNDCSCPAYKLLGFEVFEAIILSLIFRGIIVIFVKIGMESRNWIQKYREMKHAREEQKYKDYAKKFGTKSTAGPGPKRTKNRKRHSSEKLSYEKGIYVFPN